MEGEEDSEGKGRRRRRRRRGGGKERGCNYFLFPSCQVIYFDFSAVMYLFSSR